MKYSLLILLLLLPLFSTNLALADDNISYYELNEQIWEKDTQANTKTLIANGINILFSSTKTKFLYTYDSDNRNYKSSDIDNIGIHIYNTQTKEDKILLKLKDYEGYPNFHYINWSPDDKYIACGSMTDIIGQNIIFDAITGKELINSIITHEDSFAWISEHEIVYSDIQNVNQNNYLIQTATLTIIDILTDTKKILKQGDADHSYNFLKLTDNKNILFGFQIYKERSKNYDPVSSTYWLIDKDSKNEKQIEAEYKNNGWQLK